MRVHLQHSCSQQGLKYAHAGAQLAGPVRQKVEAGACFALLDQCCLRRRSCFPGLLRGTQQKLFSSGFLTVLRWGYTPAEVLEGQFKDKWVRTTKRGGYAGVTLHPIPLGYQATARLRDHVFLVEVSEQEGKPLYRVSRANKRFVAHCRAAVAAVAAELVQGCIFISLCQASWPGGGVAACASGK